MSPKTKPINAVGIVPAIISGISFPFSVLKSKRMKADRMFLMSFLKKTKITASVPTCKMTSKSIGAFKFRNCSASFRCPVLDIGSHSVKP